MSFFSELKRRNVFKVAAAYIIVGWLLLQVSDTLVPALHLPEWFHSGVAFLLIIGFPLAVIFAWAFEMTPEGLRRETEVDPARSITSATGEKLNRTIIVVLVLALAYFVFDKFVLDPRRDTRLLETALGTQQQGPEPADSDMQTDHKSIAVLPFQNRSANAENAEFFADGVHDEILTMLSKISDLKVISRTSVMSYRDTAKTMQQIGEELGVATVLEGGVQRAGDMLRINVQLIDTASDQHLWAEVMDRQLTAQNIFEIQSDIAQAIANALHATLSPREKALISTTPTTNLEAYENLLIARRLFEQENWQDLRDSQTYLQRAIDIDPGYVQAYTLLARTYSSLYHTGATTLQETRESWEHAVQTALSLDDQHAGAHAAYAGYLWATGQEGVIGNFKKARELEPANVDIMVMYGRYLYKNYLPDQALPLFKTARELDPVSIPVLFGLARVYHALGETDEALEIYTRIRTINPSSSIGYGPASGVHMELGYRVQSTRLLYQAVTLDPEDSDLSNWIALAYLDFGDLARAGEVLAWIKKNQKTNPMTPAGMTVLNIYRDDIEGSHAISQQALDERQPSRWGSELPR
jgi:TolB-like protein/cytochrome c-type biogenesis protein CcmH/NrfG